MTDFELIMVMLGIPTLLCTAGSMLIALLSFLDKRNRKHK